MSSNTFIQDALTRHQVYLGRLAGGASKDIISLLDQLIAHTQKQLALGRHEELPLYRLVKIREEVLNEVERLNIASVIEAKGSEFAAYEVQYMENLLVKATSVSRVVQTSPELIYGLVSTKPMTLTSTSGKVTRVTVPELVENFTKKIPGDITRVIQFGVAEGQSVDTISRNVTRMVNTRTKRQADALTRTVINHVGQESRLIAVEANRAIIVGEEYVATLDSRTTLICAGFDGKVFDIGKGPIPPLHYNCRSTRSPKIDPSFGLDNIKGERPAKGSDGKKVVSGDSTYSGWLRKQDKEFQDDVLGPERGKLFRSGKVKLDRFTDNTGQTINLDVLTDKDGNLVK